MTYNIYIYSSGDVPLQIVPENKINVKDDAISITGCTGKTLLLNKEWINPSGQWKIGMKSLYDLFPKSLLSRIKDVFIIKIIY